MTRDSILRKVQTALRRDPGQPFPNAPAVRLQISTADPDARLLRFHKAVENLAGKIQQVASLSEARAYASALLKGGTAIASNAPLLRECGITALAGVRTGVLDAGRLRSLCAAANIGITSADYALADTGTLVMLSSTEEARMISLLPPVHLAVIRRGRILADLDELFSFRPRPDLSSSSMVLITGSSRTADIEQILIRGVHGPGELHVVIVQ